MSITPINKNKDKVPTPPSNVGYTCISVQKDCIIVGVNFPGIGRGITEGFGLDESKEALKLFNTNLKKGYIAVPAIVGNNKLKGSPDIPK